MREYWLVQPDQGMVTIYLLNETSKFIGLQPLTALDSLTSTIFPDLVIDLGPVLEERD